MSRAPTPLPESLPLPVFTVEEARACGVDRSRVLASDLRRLRRGLYCTREPRPTARDVAAALCRNDEELVVVGRSAAIFWGLPMPRRATMVPLTVHAPCRRGGDDAIVNWSRRRIDQEAVVVEGGVRLLDRAATWASLGTTLRLTDLVIIADHLRRRPRAQYEGGRTEPYATRAQLAAAIERSPRTGRPRLQEALALSRAGADSPMETRLRLALAEDGLPEPVLNRPVLGADGRPILMFDRYPDGEPGPTPDMQWAAQRVAVEYDGDHHLTREQKDSDVQRAERFRRLGWLVVVVTGRDMHHGGQAAVRRVRAALRERGWRPEL